ncbi:hypothetical protein BG004_002801 [Podila humilis]|nr:hypothetical protein BG004_002801 [Podila humilis]
MSVRGLGLGHVYFLLSHFGLLFFSSLTLSAIAASSFPAGRAMLPTFLAALYFYVALCHHDILLFCHFVQAQSSFTPWVTHSAVSAFVDGKALYVQGGVAVNRYFFINQTFLIDLSVPWEVKSPVSRPLHPATVEYDFPSAILKDEVTWVRIYNTTLSTYNIQTGAITYITTLNDTVTQRFNGHQAALIPETGEFIVPILSGITTPKRTTLYSSTELTVIAIVQPPQYIGGPKYAFVWSESHQSAFLLGELEAERSGVLSRLDVKTGNWNSVITNAGPTPRSNFCLVAAQGGDKLVMFGGNVGASDSLGDIHVFDIASNTWTRGQDGGLKRSRTDHVCAMSGSQFIAWGGYSATSNSELDKSAVYDLIAGVWLDQYVPSGPWSSTIAKPKTTPGPGDNGAKSNVGAIAGGVGCGIVVVFLLAFFIYQKRRVRKSKNELPQQVQPHVDTQLEGKLEYTEPILPSYPHLPGRRDVPETNTAYPPQKQEQEHSRQPWIGGTSFIQTHQHSQQQEPREEDGPTHGSVRSDVLLRDMQHAERVALDELIAAEQEKMELQRLAHEKRLQVLMEQRQAYQATLELNRSPQDTSGNNTDGLAGMAQRHNAGVTGVRGPQLR